MKSYLLSSLAFRFGSAEADTFSRAFPHDWLLWEPGAWKAPASTTHLLSGSSTPAPSSRAGEALALALEPRADAAPLKLGRGAECDAIINDGTLSQVHLVFMKGPDGWTVRDANSRNGSKLDAIKLEPGKPMALTNGSRLVAAQVAFTYYNSAGMLARLKGL